MYWTYSAHNAHNHDNGQNQGYKTPAYVGYLLQAGGHLQGQGDEIQPQQVYEAHLAGKASDGQIPWRGA